MTVRGWESRACAGVGTERFFPPKDSPDGGPPNRWDLAALAVCGWCRVRGVCLEAALEFPAAEQHGVLGGMTAGQRRGLLRAQRRRPVRSYLDGLSGLVTRARVEPGVDGLVVTRLMAGEPVPGATRAEAAHAAVMLHRCGYGTAWIAARLGEHERQIDRWKARHEAGEPLLPRSPTGRRPGGGGGMSLRGGSARSGRSGWLPTAQAAAARTRMHTAVSGRPGCRGGRCRVLGAARVVLCERHAAALLVGGVR